MAKLWAPFEQNFINHPKFIVLSPGAICLWIEGKNYCDQHLTDGLIPRAALRTFRFTSRKHVQELTGRLSPQSAPLWETHAIGFKVHDYLDHNPCHDEVKARMLQADAARERHKANQAEYRERHKRDGFVTGHAAVTDASPESPRAGQTTTETETTTDTMKREIAFDQFWGIFPNHDGEKKTRAWFTTCKPPHGLIDRILAGAARYAAYVTAKGTDPQYIKSAVRWLEEACYDNPYALPAEVCSHLPTFVAEQPAPHPPIDPAVTAQRLAGVRKAIGLVQ